MIHDGSAPLRECSHSHRRSVRLLLLVLVVASALPVFAQSGSLELDGGKVNYAIYAPQWIWQRQNVNIIAVFENELPATATVGLTLHYPLYYADRFKYTGPISQELVLGPGARGRLAIANMVALAEKQLSNGRSERLPPGFYVFMLELAAESVGKKASTRTDYQLRTVRGAVVPEGLLAKWLPAGLILLWCGLIFLILPRMAQPGAWRRPSEPVDEAEIN